MLFQNQVSKMKISNINSASLVSIFLAFLSSFQAADAEVHDDFLQCLSLHSKNSSAISQVIYTPNNSSYLPILQSPVRNLRFNISSTPRPLVIVTPVQESQIQAVVLCSKQNKLQIRTRSGGHDFEGLSYTSPVPFIIIDMINMSHVTVDVESKTAWVQSGVTVGQLYYRIGQISRTLAFPSRICPTIGVGGHFSGGGYGFLIRKYGLAADHVVDARLVDVKGRILDRKSMGEDLFWAIRGGGGASFGVITAWKVNLVSVPENLTACAVNRTLEENATQAIIHKWQFVAPNLPNDLFMPLIMSKVNSTKTGNKTILATFNSIFLGRVDKLLELLEERFPELGVTRGDCIEASWLQLAVLSSGYPIDASPEVLTSRIPPTPLSYFKIKSDYVPEPIPEYGFEGIWKILFETEGGRAGLTFIPYGGRMAEVSESATPFPHRAGNLYKIVYFVSWAEEEAENSDSYMSWTRRFYNYMTPYVSKSPRSAYLNYRDLDIGVNNEQGKTSYKQASIWGLKYFNNNFNRLVHVKTMVDPENFFRNEQSIPPLHSKWTNKGD